MTSGQAADWATVASAVILAFGAIFAWRQVREARRLREAQFRPFVVVDFDVDSHPPLIHLVISNLGPVMARDVTFAFEPELSSSFDDGPIEGGPPRFTDLPLFREGLPTLPPGKRISVLFDSWLQRGDRPGGYRVNVRYRGERSRPYEEEMRLDLAPFRYLRHVQTKTLSNVYRELKRIADDVHRWTAPSGGLKVKSPRDIRREYEEWERQGATQPSDDEGAEAREGEEAG